MDSILVRGARTHNLKQIDVELPRDKLIVIFGLVEEHLYFQPKIRLDRLQLLLQGIAASHRCLPFST